MRKTYFAFIAFILIALVACATAKQKESYVTLAYKTLEIGAITYDTAMKSLADLYKKGFITEAEKNRAIEIGNKYRTAYSIAVDALASYKKIGDTAKQKRLEQALDEVNKFISELQRYLRPYFLKALEG